MLTLANINVIITGGGFKQQMQLMSNVYHQADVFNNLSSASSAAPCCSSSFLRADVNKAKLCPSGISRGFLILSVRGSFSSSPSPGSAQWDCWVVYSIIMS